jgi:hypothetical protein
MHCDCVAAVKNNTLEIAPKKAVENRDSGPIFSPPQFFMD